MKIYITEAQFKKLTEHVITESIEINSMHELLYEIGEKAKAIIDYLYNEGVVEYDDEHLTAMVNNMRLIDFKDICKSILFNYSGELNVKEEKILKDYLKTGSNPELEDQILRVIREYEKLAHQFMA